MTDQEIRAAAVEAVSRLASGVIWYQADIWTAIRDFAAYIKGTDDD